MSYTFFSRDESLLVWWARTAWPASSTREGGGWPCCPLYRQLVACSSNKKKMMKTEEMDCTGQHRAVDKADQPVVFMGPQSSQTPHDAMSSPRLAVAC